MSVANQIIYILGNKSVHNDSQVYKILPYLKKKFPLISFVPFDPTEDIPEIEMQRVIILDMVKNIKEVKLFKDINQFILSPRFSTHDFDLPLFLGILKKLGKVINLDIIGIPETDDHNKNLFEVVRMIKSIGL
ncbi:hypothetical protein COY59_02365 [Candidatus Gottesmanbacteria bacterium CG_4_10_14_0_8_um_filter_37_24]|uniref:NADPH-dependent FMN reductase-like domain-containing protein n=1 Tax=Candidatus Gottesmanbacteria bacterium CG_4_10_14_0_8_um_filter_37_24 TaxID=1974574 RepID=A0A2M7RRH5_9BACT|nr:MAG: hypothetical protein COX23_04650 [Candidatus Gottesmanbacteria bacterium CG23_combo_of_CG06-09_8_20_14_all_37_19]PIZ02882.1 MAG: hypothetical protein COY59_02365 [Candidatus Gottesmanbacteria bacterium CG_4_10_14_0_8_um_filter_37_24]